MSTTLPYAPNLAGNVIFLAIHAACLGANVFLGIKFRTWGYLASMGFGCILEVLGHVGRVKMHYNPFPEDPFLLYLIWVTIASIFFTAAIYLCFSRAVIVFGEHLSILRARTYTLVFIFCDFVALLLQAGGGTMVSFATDSDFEHKGLHVMQAGLIFQVASLVVFLGLCFVFFSKCRANGVVLNEKYTSLRASKRFSYSLSALSISTVTMITRCAFQVAELSEGFKGHIWYNEIDYMVLEGVMISLCVLLLTVGHPGLGFRGRYHETGFTWRAKKGATLPDNL